VSREPERARRRFWRALIRAGRSTGDPGAPWTLDVLAPLRRQTIECDVASRIMSRIVVRAATPGLSTTSPAVPRLALASSLLLGSSALAFLGSTLVVLVLGGDEGVRQVVGLGLSGWHVLVVLGRLAAGIGAGVAASLVPILRACWTLLEVAAPLLRGAGLLAAAGGVLSILLSTYVFASARKTAPRVDLQGGLR
jgi:hypothetical protein